MGRRMEDWLNDKQDAPRTDGRFKEFVKDVTGYDPRQNNHTQRGSQRQIDEQNRMIDQQNLRK